jgi:undecaprenyl-diphosphatase
MNKTKNNFIISAILLIFAVVYTILVQCVDVKAIGPENSSVGFATINEAVRDSIGLNETLYDITKYLGYLSLLLAAAYALVGFIQLVKRKSLLKVDKEILMLAGFYVVVIAVYVLFEIFIVNYRPVILEEGLEASYPSSHTVLSICVCGSAVILNKKLFNKVKGIKAVNILSIVLLVLTTVGRLLSGVHWFSDILGGVIISSALLMTFYSIINMDKKEDKQ